MATADKVSVTKSATIGVDQVTIAALTAAATKVGAPEDAIISTTGGVQNANNQYQPGVTFSWSEEV